MGTEFFDVTFPKKVVSKNRLLKPKSTRIHFKNEISKLMGKIGSEGNNLFLFEGMIDSRPTCILATGRYWVQRALNFLRVFFPNVTSVFSRPISGKKYTTTSIAFLSFIQTIELTSLKLSMGHMSAHTSIFPKGDAAR